MSNNIEDIITMEYQNFKKRIAQLIPKVDEDLVAEILKFQTTREKQPGSVTLTIKYQSNSETEFDTKKERLYEKYKMLPSEMYDRALRLQLQVYIWRILLNYPKIQKLSILAVLLNHHNRTSMLQLNDNLYFTKKRSPLCFIRKLVI